MIRAANDQPPSARMLLLAGFTWRRRLQHRAGPTASATLAWRFCPECDSLVVMAYFNAVMFAVEEYFPDVGPALFGYKRSAVIGHIWKTLLAEESSHSSQHAEALGEAIDMTVVPLMYAVRYRVRRVARTDLQTQWSGIVTTNPAGLVVA